MFSSYLSFSEPRLEAKLQFRAALHAIIEKYDNDFEDESDIIDLETMTVIENKGDLLSMNECPFGSFMTFSNAEDESKHDEASEKIEACTDSESEFFFKKRRKRSNDEAFHWSPLYVHRKISLKKAESHALRSFIKAANAIYYEQIAQENNQEMQNEFPLQEKEKAKIERSEINEDTQLDSEVIIISDDDDENISPTYKGYSSDSSEDFVSLPRKSSSQTSKSLLQSGKILKS